MLGRQSLKKIQPTKSSTSQRQASVHSLATLFPHMLQMCYMYTDREKRHFVYSQWLYAGYGHFTVTLALSAEERSAGLHYAMAYIHLSKESNISV